MNINVEDTRVGFAKYTMVLSRTSWHLSKLLGVSRKHAGLIVLPGSVALFLYLANALSEDSIREMLSL